MTRRDEFVRQHPDLAAELVLIGQRAIVAAAASELHSSGRVDTDVLYGGLPTTAGCALLVTGMTAWSWSLWLILPAVFLGMGVLAWVAEIAKWLALFSARLAARAAWLRGSGTGPARRGGDR